MFLSPVNMSSVNFAGRTEYLKGYGATKQERYRDLEKELTPACIARRAGVDAPNYQVVPMPKGKSEELRVKYELHGEPANLKTNPITPKHLDSLFTNFYNMEEIGYCHGYLSDDNVLYGKNGRVQIASMRDLRYFINTKGEFIPQNENIPSFVMPANSDNYEIQSLCTYVSKMDEDEQTAFLEVYLKNKSDYHKARARFLEKRGVHPSSKTFKFERVRGKVFENPSDDVVNFQKDKLNILNLKKQATIMWHDGDGFFTGELAPKKRFKSIIVMLEAFKQAEELTSRAEFLSKNAQDKDEREYFAIERQCLETLRNNIWDDVRIGGDGNFCCPKFGSKGLYLGSMADRKFFNDQMKAIKSGGSANSKIEAIDTTIRFYTDLISDWNSESNYLYKQEYLAAIPSSELP